MLKFGILAEGTSDQKVIENILLGYFQDQEELFVTYVRPLPGESGGWSRVFDSLRRGDVEKTLQTNHYAVIHIDTDVQEEAGFDVSRREQGKELSIPDRVARVVERLKKDIDTTFLQANADRLLFAVAVDSVECWLLPLLYDKKKAGKTTGCLKAANDVLRKSNRNGLSAGDKKFTPAYDQTSRDYTKRKELMKFRDKNPSLELFIQQLDDLQSRLAANQHDELLS